MVLAGRGTVAEAAAAAGSGVRTVMTWLAAEDGEFRPRVWAIRAAVTEQAVGRLAAAMASATDTLAELSRSAVAESTRLRAAEAVLAHGLRLREEIDTEARLARLEAAEARGG